MVFFGGGDVKKIYKDERMLLRTFTVLPCVGGAFHELTSSLVRGQAVFIFLIPPFNLSDKHFSLDILPGESLYIGVFLNTGSVPFACWQVEITGAEPGRYWLFFRFSTEILTKRGLRYGEIG